jgi:hypothetical protein
MYIQQHNNNTTTQQQTTQPQQQDNISTQQHNNTTIQLQHKLVEDLHLCDSVASGAFPPFFNPPPPIPPNILHNHNKE